MPTTKSIADISMSPAALHSLFIKMLQNDNNNNKRIILILNMNFKKILTKLYI